MDYECIRLFYTEIVFYTQFGNDIVQLNAKTTRILYDGEGNTQLKMIFKYNNNQGVEGKELYYIENIEDILLLLLAWWESS